MTADNAGGGAASTQLSNLRTQECYVAIFRADARDKGPSSPPPAPVSRFFGCQQRGRGQRARSRAPAP
jgi:hypothetical protein